MHNVSGEKSATPKVEVTVESAVDSTTSVISEAPRVVQGSVVARAPEPKWKWTPKKREALNLMLSGGTVTQVAERVGVHRNTLTNWTKTPAWLAEQKRYIEEEQISSRLRRVKTTAIIADKLGAKALSELSKDLKEIDPTRAGLMLREHLNYTKSERDLYGENGQPQGGPGTAININVGGPNGTPLPSTEHQATALTSFTQFLEAYDPALAVVAHSPQEAAALMAEKVLQESNLLDTIREEDREVFRREADAEEATKRRR